jgi:hypothetical protein
MRAPSLRAQRSNPAARAPRRLLDCFVAPARLLAMTRLAPQTGRSATICKLLQWNDPATLPDCVRAAAKSATICKRRPLRRSPDAPQREAKRNGAALIRGPRLGPWTPGLRRTAARCAAPGERGGAAPGARCGSMGSCSARSACSACYRLFRSLRPLWMLHCTGLLTRILPNDCNGLDPFPAATCCIAVSRRACIFADIYKRRALLRCIATRRPKWPRGARTRHSLPHRRECII